MGRHSPNCQARRGHAAALCGIGQNGPGCLYSAHFPVILDDMRLRLPRAKR